MPLLEREEAVDAFTQAVDLAHHSGKLLLVSGEAGIGKTAFLEHMRRSQLGEHRFLWSGCDPLSTPRPYAPIFELASDMSNALLSELSKETVSTKMASTFYHALEKLPAGSVCIIEDAHWADHATLDLIRFVARRISFLSCVICISYRDDEVDEHHPFHAVLHTMPSAHTVRLTLSALSVEAVNRLTDMDQDLTQQNAHDIHRISGGNPFFVTELLANRSLDPRAIPMSIKESLSNRLSLMSTALRDCVQTLSVIPYGIPIGLVEKLFGQGYRELINQCVTSKFLQLAMAGEVGFRHELMRLAIMETVPQLQQQDIHGRILQVLEDMPAVSNPGWLADHAEGAADLDKIFFYTVKAAKDAAKVGAHKEAAAYLSRALAFAHQAEDEMSAELHERWAYEVGLTTHMEQSVIDAVQHAIALWRGLKRLDKVGKNLRFLARLYWYQGQAKKAEQVSLDAIEVFEQLPKSGDLAMAYSMRAQLDMLNDRTQEAIHWSDKALVLEKQFPNPLIRSHALTNKGSALVLCGDESGEALLMESLVLAKQHSLHEDAARVYTNLSDYLVRYKMLEKAEKVIEAGIQYDVEHDLDSWTYYLVGIQAMLRLEQGRLQDAATIAQGVQSLNNQTLLMKLPALIVLGRSLLRIGDERAAQTLNQGLEHALATDENQYLIPARFGLVEQAFFLQDLDQGKAHLDWLFAHRDKLNVWQWGEYLFWGQLFGVDSGGEVQTCAKPYELALSGDLEQASKAFDQVGMPFQAGLVWLLNTDASDSASLINAYAHFENLGAKAPQQVIRKWAERQNWAGNLPKEKRGPYKKSRQHPLGLTNKEQAVLHLMMEGASNQDMADTLCRSIRTVENHVSSVLSKMNVANRVEAVLRVQNEPWLLEPA